MDKPRFLVKSTKSVQYRRKGRPPKMSDDEAAGYTTQQSMKLRSEGEPVSGDEQVDITNEAHRRAALERQADVDKRVEDVRKQWRSFSEQMRSTAMKAAEQGVSVAEAFAEVKRALERLERKVKR